MIIAANILFIILSPFNQEWWFNQITLMELHSFIMKIKRAKLKCKPDSERETV
jgi:hypothetical protein